MADNFYGFEDGEEDEKGRDNLFLWTIFILLLIGVAAGCWMGSFYIFGHPEDPRWYKLLRKLKKLEAPKRFEVTAAPPGEFLTAAKLFEKYGKYKDLQLEQENAELMRNYIKNFRETKKLTPYITGRFNIIDSYELKKTDMFQTGMVVLAQSIDFPQVLIEHVYPSAKENVTAIHATLQTGLDMPIERTNDLSAIIHIEKIPDGRLQFTLVPLLYGTYAVKHGVGTFGLEPPEDLHMEGGVPIIKGPELKQALTGYIQFKRNKPSTADAAPDAPPPPAAPEIVRLDTVEPGKPVPETGTMPQIAIATPVPIKGGATPMSTPRPRIAVAAPVATPTPVPRPIASTSPVATPPRFAMNTTPVPRPVEPAIPVAPPIPPSPPSSVGTSPTGVPLKPFIASAPAPGSVPTAPGTTWRTYQPGRAPSARAITPADAGAIASRGDLGEKLYLHGDFRVTASGENRAVLRDRAAGADPSNPSPVDTVRIIVEYPAGAVPPGENSTLNRDASRPFEIRDIRKGADGQVNIYVREIMAQ